MFTFLYNLLTKFPPICNLCWSFEATSMENGAANMLKASCDQSLRNWDCWIENGSSTLRHWGPGTGGTYAYAPGGSWNLRIFAVFVVGSGSNDRSRSWLLVVDCWLLEFLLLLLVLPLVLLLLLLPFMLLLLLLLLLWILPLPLFCFCRPSHHRITSTVTPSFGTQWEPGSINMTKCINMTKIQRVSQNVFLK